MVFTEEVTVLLLLLPKTAVTLTSHLLPGMREDKVWVTSVTGTDPVVGTEPHKSWHE